MEFSKNATMDFKISKIKSGDMIKAMVFGGGICDRILWEIEGDTAYISSPECYERMLAGDPEARPTGFLLTDLILE